MTNHSVDVTSHDSFSREDAKVLGEKQDTYRYPFSKEPQDFSQAINMPWEGSLPETTRGEDGIYRKEGFDLKEALMQLNGPIVEIGGPTLGGFDFLHNVDLPSQPHIMNIRGSRVEAIGSDSLTAIDSLALSALANVSALPVADESLGMMLAAGLPGQKDSIFREIAADKTLLPGEQLNKVLDVLDSVYVDTADKIEAGDEAALEASDAPRIAAIAQAKRTLKPGGLFILRGLEPRDVDVANAVGLELMMHTPHIRNELHGRSYHLIQEAVFKKPG